MKMISTKTTKAGLGALALQLGIVAGLDAGGPGRLQLPLAGVTAKNGNQCIKLFEEKLGDFLTRANGTSPGRGHVVMVKKGSTNLIQISFARGQISLSEVEKALEGSPFSINREEFEHVGLVQLRIGKIANHEKLIGALADVDGKKLRSQVVKDKDGSLLITLRDRKLMGSPLFTHQRLTSFLSKSKINLIEISWGATHCSAPFGARPVAAAVAQK
jgi:hypothetical protein